MNPNQHDLDTLLAPISAEAPAGITLEFEGAYDAIREARREDDANLPQGIWEVEYKRADWARVRNLSVEALATRSKDLQLAVWVLESSIAIDGFAGADFGLKVLGGLCETFWDEMYPAIENGDIEYRLLPFEWMNEKLSLRLKSIPLTAPTSEEAGIFTWADLEAARRLENMAVKDQKILKEAEREGAVTMTRFDGSMMLTPDSIVRKLHEHVEGSLEAFERLRTILREKCGDNAPSLARFGDQLQTMRVTISSVLRSRGMSGVAASPSPAEENMQNPQDAANGEAHMEEPLSAGGTFHEHAGVIRSRTEAYAMLSNIADYLMKIEPHSPTPYLIKRAVSWGSKPLPMLLDELMDGKDDLGRIYTLLGIGKG